MKLNKIVKSIILCVTLMGICELKAFAFSSHQEEVNLDNMITEIKNYQYRETKYQVELLDILDQAKKEMIPVTPLLNKIKEGLAKDIGLRDIIDVVNKNKDSLKLAQSLLGEFENRGLKKGKDANWKEFAVLSLSEYLMRDLSEETARKLADQVVSQRADGPRFLILCGMFVDLKEKELKEDIIWSMVNVVLEQNLRDSDTKDLINNINKKIDSGGNIEAFIKQLEKDKPARALGRK
ncbi:MAG: hypothetical protein PHX78_05255 [bacterium]|nr:hypothetical protein [bacterium]